MYIQQCIVVRSRNHCCRGNAKIRSLFACVGVDVAADNVEVFNVATEVQQWVPFALLSCCKIFRTAMNSNKY